MPISMKPIRWSNAILFRCIFAVMATRRLGVASCCIRGFKIASSAIEVALTKGNNPAPKVAMHWPVKVWDYGAYPDQDEAMGIFNSPKWRPAIYPPSNRNRSFSPLDSIALMYRSMFQRSGLISTIVSGSRSLRRPWKISPIFRKAI